MPIPLGSKIVVVGYAHGCQYCDEAKALLSDMKYPFTFITIEGKPDLRDFLKALGLSTVPAIFVDGSLVGGYTQLTKELGGEA